MWQQVAQIGSSAVESRLFIVRPIPLCASIFPAFDFILGALESDAGVWSRGSD